MKGVDWVEGERPVCCKVCRVDAIGTSVARITAQSGLTIDATRCRNCGSIDLVDAPESGTSTEHEVDAYVEVGAGIATIATAFDDVDPAGVTRFLDVGCGYGFALDLARFSHGWTVVGVEPSLAGRRGAAELDLDIRHEFLSSDTELGDPFDLILASEVVEHVTDPLAFLQALRSHLRATGTLILTTPAAEVVTPSADPNLALCAVSPGYHTFVASAGALEQLLEDAGFHAVQVTRDGWSLRATARGSETEAVPGERSTGGTDVEAYLRHHAAGAPAGSALRLGAATRLFGDLVGHGRLDEADSVVEPMRHDFAVRHGVDLSDPTSVAAAVDSDTPVPWSAVAASFGLGLLELNLRGNAELAAVHFDNTERLAQYWSAQLDVVDLAIADLRFQGAYHRALARTQFAPESAANEAMLLPGATSDEMLVEQARCRIFVDLVARGQRTGVDVLQRHVTVTAPELAGSDVADRRTAGLDTLYSLGVMHLDAGDALAAQAMFVQCLNICTSRPLDDAHAEQLAALCRSQLGRPEGDVIVAPPRRRTLVRRLAMRALRMRSRLIGDPVTWFVSTYWSDTWGTYLDGWVNVGALPVREIRVESNGTSVAAEIVDRDDENTGFSVYVPGHFHFPAGIVVRTDQGHATSALDLPARPRPVHPTIPPSIPGRKVYRAMAEAPDGPALAMGVRAQSQDLADLRASVIRGREVVGLDIHAGFGVDVVGDVHRLSELFPPNHFSVVYSEALLEHVQAPWLVAAESAKVLKVGGIAVHVAPWVWPTHSQPNDFWRFSDRGLASLFHSSLGFRVIDCGGSGGAIIAPTPDWRHDQLRFPTHASPAMSWVIAEKVAEPDPVVWPYTDADFATAQEYPLDGLSDQRRPSP